MSILSKLVNTLDQLLKVLLVFMMTVLVLDVVWQILTRFVLPQPSSFTEEVARFLLIWISLLGGAFAYRQKLHLGFDLIVSKLSPSHALIVQRICCALVAIFAIAILGVGGSNLVMLTWVLGQHSPVLGISMAYVYSALPLSGFLFLVYSIHFAVNTDVTPDEIENIEMVSVEKNQ